jgi:hypothetical protein
MIKNFTLFLFLLFTIGSKIAAQKVDSIFFHLYTDSLKKGQHNYINVDGKLSNGNWLPLTAKEITLTCSVAEFQGNELIIPSDFSGKSVTVKAVLKSNPAISIERVIWIKQLPDPPLPTKEDIIKTPSPADKKTKRRN